MTELQSATVLLTGASGGFGQEFIKQLIAAGSYLILTDRDRPHLEHTLSTLIPNREPILATLEADLNSRSGCQSLYDQVIALHRPIDILINNAGIAIFGRMDEVPSEKWEEVMQLNLLTPMRLSTLFVPQMIERQSGHIVNISSVAGWSAPAGLAHYSASKFGLRGFSEGLANELKPFQVKVTAVYPYFSRTPILRSPGYGSLAQRLPEFPENQATDPAQVIHHILQGILQNRTQIFPDRTAQMIHLLKRYSPQLLQWLSHQLSEQLTQK